MNFCTYFDKDFLIQGLTCLDTLKKYNPEANFFILALDNFTKNKLQKLNLNYIHIIQLSSLFKKFPILEKEKKKRKKIEFFFMLTPFLVYYLLKKKINYLFYVDADLVFFSNIKKIKKMLNKYDIIASYHDRKSYLKYSSGKFNVGFLGFKYKKNVLNQILNWKKQCLISTTLNKNYSGVICGDQKYIESWEFNKTIKFAGIKINNFNIGAWNIDKLNFFKKNNKIFCDNKKLYCIHANFIKFEKKNNFFTSVRKNKFLNFILKNIFENTCFKYKIQINKKKNIFYIFNFFFIFRKYIYQNLFEINKFKN